MSILEIAGCCAIGYFAIPVIALALIFIFILLALMIGGIIAICLSIFDR